MSDQEEVAQDHEGGEETTTGVSKKQRYRKDKPWDSEEIDHWKVVTISKDDVKGPFLEESSFATLFPKYREKYLREVWPAVTSTLDKHGIACVLDLVEGSMTVKTTRKAFDPYIILKARDLIKLLARSVPFHQAEKILEDDVACDIVKIGNIVRNKEKFVKRRQRLLGPNGNTLKALELLTGCYLLVQGNTVSVMGSYKGLKICRRVITDCLKNIHPIYHIKELMIKRELASDPTLAKENWDRFLPKFKKQNQPKPKKDKEGQAAPAAPSTAAPAGKERKEKEKDQGKEKEAKKKKKEYTPFPPAQTPRKVDLQIESGEYFLKPEVRAAREMKKKKEAQHEATEKKKAERAKAYVAPKEDLQPTKSREQPAAKEPGLSIEQLKERFKKQGEEKKRKMTETTISESVSDYISQPQKKRKM